MKRYQITVSGRTFEVRLLSDPRQGQVQVEVDGQTFAVRVEAAPAEENTAAAAPPSPAVPVRDIGPSPAPAVASPSGRTVMAPLPGVIKSIAVQPGQQVTAGDRLLVIEAMKMDNVIRASRQGTVETIHVTAGQQVAHGEPMLAYRD